MTGTERPAGHWLALGGVGIVLLFLFAIRLLGAATEAAAPVVGAELVWLVSSDASALGFGWIATYAVMNGSVVAAVGASLFASGVLSVGELFLLVAGTRLASAAVVVLLGAVDYLQHPRRGVVSATGLGILAFVLTLTVYLPATAVGYLALPTALPYLAAGDVPAIEVGAFAVADPLIVAINDVAGPLPTLLLAIGLLLASLWLLDSLLARVETGAFRRRLTRYVGSPWRGLAVGMVLTSLTTSVSFSLGVVVPLYNRGFVEREEMIPYVLGANVGTLLDTLVVGLVLESPLAAGAVLVLGIASLAVTIVAMLAFSTYRSGVEALDDRLQTDRRLLLAFALALVVAPLALLVGI